MCVLLSEKAETLSGQSSVSNSIESGWYGKISVPSSFKKDEPKAEMVGVIKRLSSDY